MDFDKKELCQNLGELVLMKVAGELDDVQYEDCTEYMLKEAGWFDNIVRAVTAPKGVAMRAAEGVSTGGAPLVGMAADDVAKAMQGAIADGGVSLAQKGLGALDTAAGYINKGIDAVAAGAAKGRQITEDGLKSLDNVQELGKRFKGIGQAFGMGAKEAPIISPKTLGVGAAAGLGAVGLANLLSAAGNAKAYDPYEY